MEVGAVSMILQIPSDLVQVEDVVLKEARTSGLGGKRQ